MIRVCVRLPARRARATSAARSASLEGGALMDVGCYCVSAARLLAGEPERGGGAGGARRPPARRRRPRASLPRCASPARARALRLRAGPSAGDTGCEVVGSEGRCSRSTTRGSAASPASSPRGGRDGRGDRGRRGRPVPRTSWRTSPARSRTAAGRCWTARTRRGPGPLDRRHCYASADEQRRGGRSMKTSLGIWALGPMVTRFVPGGYQPEHLRRDHAGEGAQGHRRPRRPRGRLRVPLPQRALRGEPRRGARGARRPRHLLHRLRPAPRPPLRPRRARLARRGDPQAGRRAHDRGGGLRRRARRALHHLARDRGLQLPVPDALRGLAGAGSSRASPRRRRSAPTTGSSSSWSTRTPSPR